VRRHHQLHVVTLAVLLGSCGGSSPSIPPDESALCADVHDIRVCWACPGGDCVVPRWTPDTTPERGWRCEGGGPGRRCEDRAKGSGPFQCAQNGNDCTQRHPRMPDDGEWECIDMDGVVMCKGGEPAAAVVEGAPDLGWMCGTHAQGPRGPEKLCLDFAPDRPNGELDGWKCSYDHQRGEKRICKRNQGAKRLGGPCAAGCPEGAACVEDRCIPAKPSPSCWFDTDCEGGGTCRYGTCS
jgi:hypothetical protein